VGVVHGGMLRKGCRLYQIIQCTRLQKRPFIIKSKGEKIQLNVFINVTVAKSVWFACGLKGTEHF
jgi:hypothetical protein